MIAPPTIREVVRELYAPIVKRRGLHPDAAVRVLDTLPFGVVAEYACDPECTRGFVPSVIQHYIEDGLPLGCTEGKENGRESPAHLPGSR